MNNKLLTFGCFATFLTAFMLFDVFVPMESYTAYDFTLNFDDFKDPFLFANVDGMATKWFIYYAIEHYVLIASFFMFWRATGDDVVKWFLWLQVGDFFDYLLFYNDTYFFIESFPVSYNIVSFTLWMVFGLKLLYEWIQHKYL